MNIRIQKVTLSEIADLQTIGKQTFHETFSAANTEENMINYLEEGFSIEKLTSELNDTNTEFYFAVLDDRVIGYLKLNMGNSQTELKDEKAIEIERIYVLNEFHGKNVGQLLYNKGIQQAEANNADYIWLGVWEENSRAIAFYTKNGFEAFGQHVFKLGEDEQKDIMMKRTLRKE